MIGRIILGGIAGALFAVLLLGVAVLRAIIAVIRGNEVSTDGFLSIAAFYATAWIAAGGLVGLLWPLRNVPLGGYILGIIGMSLVVGGIAWMEFGAIISWTSHTWILIGVLTGLFGIVVGYHIQRWDQPPAA